MITRVRVKNFRSIAEADVTLEPLTVLVGKNGSGKSSFVDVLKFVKDALQIGLENAVANPPRYGIKSLLHQSAVNYTTPCFIEFLLESRVANYVCKYRFSLSVTDENEYQVASEEGSIYDESPDEDDTQQPISDSFRIVEGRWQELPHSLRTAEGSSSERQIDTKGLVLPTLTAVSGKLGILEDSLLGDYYDFYPNVLREAYVSTGNFPEVMRQVVRSDFKRDLVAALGRISGDIDDARVERFGSFLIPQMHHSDAMFRGDGWFELHKESDGTLRLLAILIALYQKENGKYRRANRPLSIEEPELSLHPGALAVLADVIREAATRRQILITTQSPDLISEFTADQLLIVERVNGATQIGPLKEHQRQIINAELFSAGDLLRIEELRREDSLVDSTA